MARIAKIRRRDGSVEEFDQDKVYASLYNAAMAAYRDEKLAGQLAKKAAKAAVDELAASFGKAVVPTVRDLRDVIEQVLGKQKRLQAVWEKYSSFKPLHKKMGFRTYLGVRDDIGLTPHAIYVLAKRYLLRNESGQIIETPSMLFRRVASSIAKVEREYGASIKDMKKVEEEFYQMMFSLEFLPNSPTLMNAGTSKSQLAGCFVLGLHDDISSIFTTLKDMALIHQTGGGTGFDFSPLRPRGDLIHSTKSVSSGPVSFMSIFDKATEVMKQGGKRRGANMGVLRVDHPDILEFIDAKRGGALENFNISVSVTDAFMRAARDEKDFELVNPRTGEVTRKLPAKDIFDALVQSAWQVGDPGLIFIDEVNRHNLGLGTIHATNPCAEQPLLAGESCTLGSINLAAMFERGKFNWEKFKRTIHKAVRFLDNVIDANDYPNPLVEETSKANRKIGLGIMGYADSLIQQGLTYGSKRAMEFTDKLMKFLQAEARKASAKLGVERGNFPHFETAKIDKKRYKSMRNAAVTTIAPTGTISLIAGCSSGIEPLFALAFVRNILEGDALFEVNPLLVEKAKEKKFYSKKRMLRVAQSGSVQKVPGVPAGVKKVFVTALDLKPEVHVRVQALCQKHIDSGVSKTVNLPEQAPVKEVSSIFMQAWEEKCKGVTVYRYGSRKGQVLSFGKKAADLVRASDELAACAGADCKY